MANEVDISKETKTIPSVSFTHGRKKLEIPLNNEQLTAASIMEYLDDVLMIHAMNVIEMDKMHKYVRNEQPIINKVRAINDGSTNEIVVENHASFMLKFKKGFMYGADLLYSIHEDTCQEAVSLLNKYLKSAKKNTLDEGKAHDVYTGGLAHRIILPKKGSYNRKKEAPFVMHNLDYRSSFVVYSKNYKKEKLFGGIISSVGDEYELVVYTDKYAFYYELEKSGCAYSVKSHKKSVPHFIGLCPIVQYYCDPDYMSPIEVVVPILDSLNTISSNCLDNIVDYVNSILLIKNARMADGTLAQVRQNGAMELLTNDPNKPASAEYLVNALNLGDVQEKYDALLKAAYDIAGVPRPSGNVTSGGDTGQARLLGGGWECADIVGDDEEKCLKIGEIEELEIILEICRKTPGCPMNDLYSSDIDVKFTRNKSDNLLVKAQALKYFYDMGMPYEVALVLANITSTPHEVAALWESHSMHGNPVQNPEISDSE